MKKVKIGLAMQILIGLILGIVVGAVFYGNAAALQHIYSP